MAFNRWMDKYIVHIYNEILIIKNDKIVPFASTWIDLEIIVLREVRQTKMNIVLYDIIYMWNLKQQKKIQMNPFIKQK